MPRRKKGSLPPEPLERETFLSPQSLFDALSAYVARQEPPPARSAVIRLAIERFLVESGDWPPAKKKGEK